MSIPTLTALCIKQIVQSEILSEPNLNNYLPETILDLIEEERECEFRLATHEWKWFVTSLGNTNPLQFYMTTRSYEDLSVLCPCEDEFSNEKIQRRKQMFTVCPNQDNYTADIISRIIRFIREKGLIYSSIEAQPFDPPQEFLTLNYLISNDAEDFTYQDIVKLAQINFPYSLNQTVNVHLESLSSINQKLISQCSLKWDEETHQNLQAFIIYYVNQKAIDVGRNRYLALQNDMTDNRIYLANRAVDIVATKEHLFGEYKGPSHNILLAFKKRDC